MHIQHSRIAQHAAQVGILSMHTAVETRVLGQRYGMVRQVGMGMEAGANFSDDSPCPPVCPPPASLLLTPPRAAPARRPPPPALPVPLPPPPNGPPPITCPPPHRPPPPHRRLPLTLVMSPPAYNAPPPPHPRSFRASTLCTRAELTLATPSPTQAFATDSGDESPWIYYRWLLGNSLAHLHQAQQAAATAGSSGSNGGSSGSSEAVEEAKAVLGEVRMFCDDTNCRVKQGCF